MIKIISGLIIWIGVVSLIVIFFKGARQGVNRRQEDEEQIRYLADLAEKRCSSKGLAGRKPDHQQTLT